MDWDHRITSDFEQLKKWEPEGSKVAVGFRPSGALHVGNLLTIGYAAAIADWMKLDLDLMCCDTDWSAHIHSHHFPENNRVMKLFYMRDCPCGEHENVAEHRAEELRPFLNGLEEQFGISIDVKYTTDLKGDEAYTDALREVLNNLKEFDEVFGGGFLRRYISPVVNVCPSCGLSHAKGASYSRTTDHLVFPCRNMECTNSFASSSLEGDIGVYYLVDPVRDPSRDVAVHVFGGDYRVAEKERATPKVQKVAEITEMATGETPAYFLAPLISDQNGKPLSKSKNAGKTVEDIDDLKEYGRRIAADVTEWLHTENKYLHQNEL
jgi:lysyl-tRNA synthetase class I